MKRLHKGAGWSRLIGAIGGAALLSSTWAAVAQADTVRVGLRDLPPGLGNPYTGRGLPHVFVWHAIFDELTRVGSQGETLPWLATEWKNLDETTWRFTLRDDVKFSNGAVMDAEAVKETFEWVISAEGAATVIGKDIVTLVDEIRVVDDHTIEIVTKEPNPVTAKMLSFVSIIEPKAWADLGVEGYAKQPVGTGPYKMEYFQPGEALAVANEVSWQDIADIDRIEYTVLPEPASRTQAIVSDQIDIDVLTARDSFPQLEAAGVEIFTYPASRTIGISIVSTKGGPFADKRVRQAANYAVNKEAIIETVYGGKGVPASQSATTNAFGFNPDVEPYPYDPEKARELLAEAGYPDGVPMEIHAITTSTERNIIYQAAVQDLTRAGFDAVLISQTFPEWLDDWLHGTWEYEAFGFGTDLTGVLDAGRAFNAFVSCKKEPPYYCNEAEMALVNAQATEFDVKKREDILQELLAINAENAPLIFLTQGFEAMAYRPRIQNFDAVNQRINYSEMIIE